MSRIDQPFMPSEGRFVRQLNSNNDGSTFGIFRSARGHDRIFSDVTNLSRILGAAYALLSQVARTRMNRFCSSRFAGANVCKCRAEVCNAAVTPTKHLVTK
jgi:hypothetical protein